MPVFFALNWILFYKFKSRFRNHQQSFTYGKKRHATELSKEVWRAKDNNVEPFIKCSIVSAAPFYHCEGSRCNQCLAEELAILSGNRKLVLNKRSKIVSKCRFTKKFKLKSMRADGSMKVFYVFCNLFCYFCRAFPSSSLLQLIVYLKQI